MVFQNGSFLLDSRFDFCLWPNLHDDQRTETPAGSGATSRFTAENDKRRRAPVGAHRLVERVEDDLRRQPVARAAAAAASPATGAYRSSIARDRSPRVPWAALSPCSRLTSVLLAYRRR